MRHFAVLTGRMLLPTIKINWVRTPMCLTRNPAVRHLALMKATILLLAISLAGSVGAAEQSSKWQKGKGWGWVWGKDDEVGALNEMTDGSRLAALRLVKQGK